MAAGGAVRDLVAWAGTHGALGRAMAEPAAAYGVVYHLELLLLFATLAAIGPLASHARKDARAKLGLAELPG
jgi:BCD family chlorophyll transporter-like MFS transporter